MGGVAQSMAEPFQPLEGDFLKPGQTMRPVRGSLNTFAGELINEDMHEEGKLKDETPRFNAG